MTTRTFNTPEELMVSLLQGEKWSLVAYGTVFFYDKKYPVSPFRAMNSDGNSDVINNSYNYCDGKTLWHKVEEKTELDLLKEKLVSGDYIVVRRNKPEYHEFTFRVNSCKKHGLPVTTNHWYEKNYVTNNDTFEQKAIHKKHKEVLDAYLADNSVDIEVLFDSRYLQQIAGVFIDSYNENWEYRIKPKKKTVNIIKFYSTKGKVLEMDKSKLSQTPKNIIDEYEIEVYDE